MGLESFRKAASSPEWLKFIGEALRLGAAGDEAERLLALGTYLGTHGLRASQ